MSQGIISQFKVTYREIFYTRFGKLLTRVATPSGGHVPQVPQWHDASVLYFNFLLQFIGFAPGPNLGTFALQTP